MKLLMTHLLVLLFLFLGIRSSCKNSNTEENRNIHISTSFNLSAGISVCIPENFYVPNSDQFWNDGTVYFQNNVFSESYLPPGKLGQGTFSFQGAKDFHLNVSSGVANMGSLIINTKGLLSLFGDISLSKSLELKSGLVKVDNNSLLLLDNLSDQAIQFDNSLLNRSYVIGRLGRSVVSGMTYYFPVGNDKSFHPLYISEAKNAGILTVNFDGDIPYQWYSVGTDKSIVMVPEIGWNIESGSQESNEFYTGLSLFDNKSDALTGDLRMFYSSNMDMLSPVIDWNVKRTDAFYLKGPVKKTVGIYALVQDESLKLPNFFLTGSARSSQFEIPDASKYSKIELTVFNRLGNQIFKSNRYLNEMDTKDYPSGTYFYELVLHEGNDIKTVRNFIEIRHEK